MAGPPVTAAAVDEAAAPAVDEAAAVEVATSQSACKRQAARSVALYGLRGA